MSDKVYANGIFGNDPGDKAPSFVVGSLSILPEKFAEWLAAQEVSAKGYVKLDITKRKDGKGWTFTLNTYKGKGASEDSLPF